MKSLIQLTACLILLFSPHTSIANTGGPPTVGMINVEGDFFNDTKSNFVDPESVFFLKINYDGAEPMIIHTRWTSDPVDTEIGLYDSSGVLVDFNDDLGPNNPLSELRFFALPAGQYFLAAGLFDTTFGQDFNATSTSKSTGIVRVSVQTIGADNIPLNYNFNGIVHADEPSGPLINPDEPNGFRSISNRALDFRSGTPLNNVLNRYQLVENGGQLDIIHLGNRNTVANGAYAFDDKPNADNIGIEPNWLANPNQTGSQSSPINTFGEVSGEESYLSLLFQISDGGGSFEVEVEFCDGSAICAVVTGPDWFGPDGGQPNIGAFAGATGVDFAIPDPHGENTLLITQAVVDLSEFTFFQRPVSVSFQNASNTNAGIAILAANISLRGGVADCLFDLGDLNLDGQVDLMDIEPFVAAIVSGDLDCQADTNFDCSVDLLDIGPFIELLLN